VVVESVFWPLKTARTAREIPSHQYQAKTDVFGYGGSTTPSGAISDISAL
jgi:hypothetical protein